MEMLSQISDFVYEYKPYLLYVTGCFLITSVYLALVANINKKRMKTEIESLNRKFFREYKSRDINYFEYRAKKRNWKMEFSKSIFLTYLVSPVFWFFYVLTIFGILILGKDLYESNLSD